jgi:hypothetical protein
MSSIPKFFLSVSKKLSLVGEATVAVVVAVVFGGLRALIA